MAALTEEIVKALAKVMEEMTIATSAVDAQQAKLTELTSGATASAPETVAAAEVELLQAQAALAGLKVRELKTRKADKAEVDAAVKTLLDFKAKLPQAPKKPKKEKKANAGGLSERDLKKQERAKARYGVEAKTLAEADKLATSSENFGSLGLNQSRTRERKTWTHVKHLGPELADKQVIVRGYMQSSKTQGKSMLFSVIRQTCFTVQAAIVNGDPAMVAFASKVPTESVVDIYGTVKTATVNKVTQSEIEIHISKIFIVQPAEHPPFFPADAARNPDAVNEDNVKFVSVDMDNRLNNRHLDLRTPVMQAITRVSTTVCAGFREYLLSQDFVEINTPKLLAGQSEGGADVFHTQYFGQPCCLAQSPQLHKQICAACSGMERVFELAPVFRAENSNTARHLCEFQGLDMEMCFKEHYHEVLDMFSDLFHSMFERLNKTCASELGVVRAFNDFEDLVYTMPEREGVTTVGTTSRTLVITFPEAIEMLRADGIMEEEQGEYDDLSTPVEKRLGALVKAKYGVDFYFLDKFPLGPRPFYTMPDPSNPKLSNSYDFFIRGQEILSGAQRVHDVEMLTKAIAAKGIDVDTVRFYIDAFRYGAMPHGGGGVGLERVVMLFLGLPNIRYARLFPRDPHRLAP